MSTQSKIAPTVQRVASPPQAHGSSADHAAGVRSRVAMDLPECLGAEEALLRESEHMLRLALDTAKLGVWRWNAGSGTEEMQWDARCKALFGLPAEARVTYSMWAGAIPLEDRIRVEANVVRALDPTDPRDDTRCEYRVRHPDGTLRWLSSTGRAFFDPDPKSPGGRRITFMAGAVRDVTEMHLAEAALRESEERFRGIFEHAATGIAISDLNGRLQSCNPAFSSMMGYSEEELCRRSQTKLLHPEDRAGVALQVVRLIAGEILSFEIPSRYVANG